MVAVRQLRGGSGRGVVPIAMKIWRIGKGVGEDKLGGYRSERRCQHTALRVSNFYGPGCRLGEADRALPHDDG